MTRHTWRAGRRRQPGALLLEFLEGRLVLSTYHVTSLLDAGAGSGTSGDLRYAIQHTNADSGPSTIAFDVTGVITLTSALPALSRDVDLLGPGATWLTVSGAIYNSRQLTVSSSTLFANGARAGGAILSDGYATAPTIRDSNLVSNYASDRGGALLNVSPFGELVLTNSVLYGNSATDGGAIYNNRQLLVQGSVVSANGAFGRGGGVYNDRAATLTVRDSSVAANSANVLGGGVYNYFGTLLVSRSSVYWNGAGSGGGIANVGTATLSNSTLSENSAYGDGGGLWTGYGPATLTNVTVTGNRAALTGGPGQGGGLFADPSELPVLDNTIVAGNFEGSYGLIRDDVAGAVSSASDCNLIGDGTGMTGLTEGVGSNLVGTADAPIDAMLGPLQDNGGPTPAHALLPDSPARGGGSLEYVSGATDQRGLARVVDGLIDIGAFQTQDYSH
jgi:hypothetical protein